MALQVLPGRRLGMRRLGADQVTGARREHDALLTRSVLGVAARRSDLFHSKYLAVDSSALLEVMGVSMDRSNPADAKRGFCQWAESFVHRAFILVHVIDLTTLPLTISFQLEHND